MADYEVVEDKSKLGVFLNPISRDMQRVAVEIDRQIEAICSGQSPAAPYREYVNSTVRHMFKAPGKLLRPALVLLSAKAVATDDRPSGDDLIKLATAVELIHSASLIHDDVIDLADSRRNQTSVNLEFGNRSAVLVGDILYSQFFLLLTSLGEVPHQRRLKLLELFSGVTREMCLGEIYEQRIKKHALEPSFEEYAAVIENKTAALMSMCCLSGAMLSDGDESTLKALADFGLKLGMAFQIVDDCLDEDSVFEDGQFLLQKARNYLDGAKACAVILPKSTIQECLLLICDYVFARVA